MKQLSLYISLLLIICCSACTKDPFDGVSSNERSIEAITLGGGLVQVGPAAINRTDAKATVKVLVQAGTDLSKVVAQIQTSYKADISPANGVPVNFTASNNQAKFTITSESGSTREWTVEIIPFTETLLGTYSIQSLVLYGGTGPEYGGGGVINLKDKPWVWTGADTPDKELDNTITFEFGGVTADGKTTGKVTNNAGPDGAYASFLYNNPVMDLNNVYRLVPTGESTWERDYVNNTVTFISKEGKRTSGAFLGAMSIDLGNGLNKTITDNSLDFTLSGTDDWGNIYSDLDKFVKRPRRFWIDIKKNQ
ncbi:hypothetical protein [Chitinophaga pinensis]|uniref:DUF1735 domain-containing protein n=1 Tax=Chitinophaga pinensis (strain ATCC 43595 / DSM 2588 / LMG 13176 / NBRC 15968 / NCIMB 11800 / UQM 2034) TaxID=485918 RepID=A0A979GXW0_CHIPD|nr:hypothetical protein [Chitinophaga pinensis]ACU62824.1 hypothetical protein Cpin_5394 [Chitinophaga pinensis DSM 2588]